MASWFEFLRIEADLAMSFIDAARIHSNPANAVRSLGNARKSMVLRKHCCAKYFASRRISLLIFG
jgi:hypothetical protein